MAVQGELKPAAQRESVDESESRYGRRPQLVENGMPNPCDGQCLVAIDDLGESSEVGARGQHERLSRDSDRRDVGTRQRGIQGSVQLVETTRAQGIRSSGTTPVVQRDQHRGTRCMGQCDVSAQCPGYDLTLASGRGLGDQLVEFPGPHAAASSSAEKCGFSQITVPPIPRPMHMVVIP